MPLYVYVLKLGDGSFYVSRTRDLRERMSEHNDANLKNKLVYYENNHSLYDASMQESVLKNLTQSNEREFLKMITGFRNKMREVSLV